MENIFEQASKQRLRYEGNVNTEDLWDLSLEKLDVMAQGLNRTLKDTGTESFIGKKNTINKTVELKLNVIVSIINTKMAADTKAKNAAARKLERNRLIELIAAKENDALTKKSVTSLKAQLEKLEEEEDEDI